MLGASQHSTFNISPSHTFLPTYQDRHHMTLCNDSRKCGTMLKIPVVVLVLVLVLMMIYDDEEDDDDDDDDAQECKCERDSDVSPSTATLTPTLTVIRINTCVETFNPVNQSAGSSFHTSE